MKLLDKIRASAWLGRKARFTPDGLRVTEFPPAVQTILRLYGAHGSYAAMYRHQPNVRTVVDFLAHEAAPIKLKLYERVSATKRLELDEHKSILLMNRPGGRATNYDLQSGLVHDIGIYDVAYWGKVRPRPSAPPGALVRIPPFGLFPFRDPVDQRILYFTTVHGVRIELDDLIIFEGYDPESNSDRVAPLETLRRILAEEFAAGLNREKMWRNAARKDGIIRRPLEAPKWNDAAREGFLTDWEAAMTGSDNSARTGILEEGMEWEDTTWSPREMEYLAARKLARDEVAAAYNLSLDLVTGKGSKEDRTAFYTGRLNSLLTRIEQTLEVQLLPEFESFDSKQRQYYEFNIEEKLKGSFEESAAIGSTAVGGPWLTVNEFRARHNLPPIPGGDVIIIPMNVERGGGPQANPQAPMESINDDKPGLEPAGITAGGDKAREKSKLLSDEMELLRGPFVELHAEELRKFFERQRRVVKAKAGTDLPDPAFDQSRWDRELAEDLQAMSLAVTGYFGRVAASKMGGEYSVERTIKYWKKASEATARTINASTAVNLVDKEIDEVFDRLAKSIAPQLALTKTNREMNWALVEAARQNGS